MLVLSLTFDFLFIINESLLISTISNLYKIETCSLDVNFAGYVMAVESRKSFYSMHFLLHRNHRMNVCLLEDVFHIEILYQLNVHKCRSQKKNKLFKS